MHSIEDLAVRATFWRTVGVAGFDLNQQVLTPVWLSSLLVIPRLAVRTRPTMFFGDLFVIFDLRAVLS